MTVQQALDLISPAAPFLSTGPSPSVDNAGQAPTVDSMHDSLTAPGAPTFHWADLGCGSGLFTTALARLLPPGSTVYGIDTHPTIRRQAPSPDRPASIIPIQADFVKDPLDLPSLDGILMANSLHYVKDKPALVQKLRSHMHPDSPFLMVEYDTDRPIPIWVPYPISYDSLTRLFKDHTIQKLGERPSAYGRANMYAALVLSR